LKAPSSAAAVPAVGCCGAAKRAKGEYKVATKNIL